MQHYSNDIWKQMTLPNTLAKVPNKVYVHLTRLVIRRMTISKYVIVLQALMSKYPYTFKAEHGYIQYYLRSIMYF